MNKINVSKLFQAKFNLMPIKAETSSEPTSIQPIPAGSVTTYTGNYQQYMNGAPVLNYIEIEAGMTPDGIKYDAYRLPDTMVVEFSESKRIVRTELAGRKTGKGSIDVAEVVEIIGIGSASFSVKGFIINNESKDWPEAEVRKLRDYMRLSTSFKIVSPFLNAMGVTEVVFQERKHPAMIGMSSVQPFELQGFSVSPVELKLAKK